MPKSRRDVDRLRDAKGAHEGEQLRARVGGRIGGFGHGGGDASEVRLVAR